jgi:hypothetical protein
MKKATTHHSERIARPRHVKRDKRRQGGKMGRAQKGRIGCGCLLFLLVLCIVLAGALIHPYSLKVIGNRFHYADKILTADVVFVPRFPEDRNGEVYTEAFREYWAGNGKSIWIEDDMVFGFTMKDIVTRMAKERGIKEGAIKALELSGDDLAKAAGAREVLAKYGVTKVILVVPEYASRRFHTLYGSEGPHQGNGVLFFIKPVDVSYFKADKWWRNDVSRTMIMRELYRFGALYLNRFKFGDRGDSRKE